MPPSVVTTPPAPAAPVLPYERVVEPSLGQRTASGFAWVMVSTIIQKVIAVGGQIVLAWLLSPNDFGAVGMAFTVVTFINLIREAGILQVLVHRANTFRRWANAAFWMSLTLSIVCSILMIVIAPFAAKVFNAPEVKGLIWVLAIGSPVFALGTVPGARLQSQLRFKLITIVGIIIGIANIGLSILMAWMKFGAYSFVWPMVITGALRVGIYWVAAPPPIRFKLQIPRWKHLFMDSGTLFLATLFYTIVTHGDYLILGKLRGTEVLGIYYFAFNLSMQTLVMLSFNLSQVLFPALSKLQDEPERQTRAFVRSARQLALVGVPLCLLQVALAGPAVRAIFAPKWHPAIPVLQVLSIGAAMRVLGMPAGTTLQAQGRFKTYMYLALFASLGFITVTTTGALLGGAVAVAVAVTIFYAITDNLSMYIAIRPGGGGWRDIWKIYAPPLIGSVIAIGIAWAAAMMVPHVRGENWIKMAIIIMLTGAIYVPIIRIAAPDAWREFVERMNALLRRSARSGA